jgi:hypothetical protein
MLPSGRGASQKAARGRWPSMGYVPRLATTAQFDAIYSKCKEATLVVVTPCYSFGSCTVPARARRVRSRFARVPSASTRRLVRGRRRALTGSTRNKPLFWSLVRTASSLTVYTGPLSALGRRWYLNGRLGYSG